MHLDYRVSYLPGLYHNARWAALRTELSCTDCLDNLKEQEMATKTSDSHARANLASLRHEVEDSARRP